MSTYKVRFYDKKGNLISETVEKYPSNVGRFQANKILDKKDGYKSSYRSKKTNGGLNRKVYKYVSTARDGSKIVTTLVEKPKSKRKYYKY